MHRLDYRTQALLTRGKLSQRKVRRPIWKRPTRNGKGSQVEKGRYSSYPFVGNRYRGFYIVRGLPLLTYALRERNVLESTFHCIRNKGIKKYNIVL